VCVGGGRRWKKPADVDERDAAASRLVGKG
jgi:hypothetical protein